MKKKDKFPQEKKMIYIDILVIIGFITFRKDLEYYFKQYRRLISLLCFQPLNSFVLFSIDSFDPFNNQIIFIRAILEIFGM